MLKPPRYNCDLTEIKTLHPWLPINKNWQVKDVWVVESECNTLGHLFSECRDFNVFAT